MLKSLVNFISGFSPATATPTATATSTSATQTVTGKLVALTYFWLNQHKRGGGLDETFGEARSSVKWEGDPAGIVTSDGRVYQIAGGLTADNNAKVSELLGQTVTITGEVSRQNRIMVISADDATPAK